MPFMSTSTAKSMPSPSTINNNQLPPNIITLRFLVVAMVFTHQCLHPGFGSTGDLQQHSKRLISSLRSYILSIYWSEQQNRFNKPLPWIVAMKLPMDLNNPMPGIVDQTAKLGSMAFMCTMMANFFPSIATMDKEFLTNMIALGVLVITLVVNVCVQLKAGVVSYTEDERMIQRLGAPPSGLSYNLANGHYNRSIAIIYASMLLCFLIMLICSAVALPPSKRILEPKYQAGHKTASKDHVMQQPGISTVEKVKQHVSKYWILTGPGSPQFLIACSATCPASGVIRVFSTIIHIIMIFAHRYTRDYKSDYKL